VLDFEFMGSLAGAIWGTGRRGHGYQSGLRNKPAEVFRMTPAHLPNPKHADSQLAHSSFSNQISVFDADEILTRCLAVLPCR
jgi:hypothetical protein